MSAPGAPPRPYRAGVGIVLLNDRGLVFVGRRSDTPGAWQMPQGGIDRGETPREAAIRELEEETGADKVELIAESRGWLSYDLPPQIAARVWRGRYRGQRQKWFVFRFTGTDADIDLGARRPEFDAWKWAPPAEIAAQIVPFKRALYRALLEEFSELLGPAG